MSAPTVVSSSRKRSCWCLLLLCLPRNSRKAKVVVTKEKYEKRQTDASMKSPSVSVIAGVEASTLTVTASRPGPKTLQVRPLTLESEASVLSSRKGSILVANRPLGEYVFPRVKK